MNENVIDEAQNYVKQYKMFLKALNFIDNNNDREDICSEMDKLELKILNLTNISYEEELKKIQKEKTTFLKEERLKLQRLVDLIDSRIDYVKTSLEKHRISTGNYLEHYNTKGEEEISKYKNDINIIDKYRENIQNRLTFANDIKNLEVKISSANDRIESNKRTNQQLERRMITLLKKVFEEYNCEELEERREEINLAYEELGYSLAKAKENVRKAKLGNSTDIIMECDNMLSSITLEYEKYKEKKYILELMDIYDKEVHDYDELLEKRETIDRILDNITNSQLYEDICEELAKQYNTIKLEQQDLDTFNSIYEEKSRKEESIEEIDEENNSEEFRAVLGKYIENERKYKEAIYLEEQKREYAERQKKILREREIQEERNRRQKLLEAERNKDIERMTKELLEKKKNPVLDKNKSKEFTIKLNKDNNLKLSSNSFKKNTNSQDNRFKEDYSMPKLEEEPFFSHKEIEDLNSDFEDKKESSWF